eukprot:4213299-Pyramimonas_sp.AAC.1
MLVGSWTRCRDTTCTINHTWVMTELFDVFILIQGSIAVLVLSVSHSTVRIRVLVESTLTERIFNAIDLSVNGVLSTGHINVINMLGREQIIARLELLVVRRG